MKKGVEVYLSRPLVGKIHAVHSRMDNYERWQILCLLIQLPSVGTQEKDKTEPIGEYCPCPHCVMKWQHI